MASSAKKETAVLNRLMGELAEIKTQLRQLLILMPEEGLSGYVNGEKIKKAYRETLKSFPSK